MRNSASLLLYVLDTICHLFSNEASAIMRVAAPLPDTSSHRATSAQAVTPVEGGRPEGGI
jgi:hypothetical protein